jgi:hypothetical protein
MRWLLIAMLVVTLGWSAYWGAGWRQERASVEAWFAAREAARFEALTVRGFPNRLDTTVEAPAIAGGDFAWSAPFVQLLRLRYAPEHYVVALAPEQRLETSAGPLLLRLAKGQASAVFEAGTLARLSLVLEAPELVAEDASVAAENLRFALRRAGAGYELGLEIGGVRPEAGAFGVSGTGELRLTPEGPVGEVTLRASDAEAAREVLRALGWLEEAAAAGEELVLVFEGGTVRVGNAVAELPEL